MTVFGTSRLYLSAGGQNAADATELFVVSVSNLVVPVLLGTPWIMNHVTRIEPRTHVVLLYMVHDEDISVPLLEVSNRLLSE